MILYFIYLILNIFGDFLGRSENIYNIIYIRNVFLFIFTIIYSGSFKIKFNNITIINSIVTFSGFFFYLKVLKTCDVYNTTLSYYLIPIFDLLFSIIFSIEKVSNIQLLLYLPLLINIRSIYAYFGAISFSLANIIIKSSYSLNNVAAMSLLISIFTSFFISNLNINLLFIGTIGATINYIILYLITNNSFQKYHNYQFFDIIFLSIFYQTFNFLFYFALIYILIMINKDKIKYVL